jgi:hypothetical protein
LTDRSHYKRLVGPVGFGFLSSGSGNNSITRIAMAIAIVIERTIALINGSLQIQCLQVGHRN